MMGINSYLQQMQNQQGMMGGPKGPAPFTGGGAGGAPPPVVPPTQDSGMPSMEGIAGIAAAMGKGPGADPASAATTAPDTASPMPVPRPGMGPDGMRMPAEMPNRSILDTIYGLLPSFTPRG